MYHGSTCRIFVVTVVACAHDELESSIALSHRIFPGRDVAATYMRKNKFPDATMPLARSIAEWTSRGDIPDSAKDVNSISQLAEGVNAYIKHCLSGHLVVHCLPTSRLVVG